MRWCVAALVLAVGPVGAQSPGGAWALFQVDSRGQATAVGGVLDVGSAAPGDFQDTVVRARNTSSAVITLSSLRIAGTGFTLENTPSLPATLVAGANVDFRVRFRPHAAGTYNATLTVQGLSVLVRGVGRAALTVLDEKGVVLSTATAIDFGTVALNQPGRVRLLLRNESSETLAVRQLGVTGAEFSLSQHAPPPFSLAAGTEMPIELICAATRAGVLSGSFSVDARVFSLVARVAAPQFPDAWLELDAEAGRSGRQPSVRVRLSAPIPTAVTGTLRVDFEPAVTVGIRDSAIQFLGNGGREVSVAFEAGSLSSRSELLFQTGTTAGTLVFRLSLGSQARELRVTIPPEGPRIEDVDLVKSGEGWVDVVVTGFDNHRSAGNVVFSFVDVQGREVSDVSVEAGSSFAQFFREDAGLGGLFRLRARFPVSGDARLLGGVRVRLANTLGVGVGSSDAN